MPPPVMLALALAVTALCLIPLGFIVFSTVTAGWDTIRRLIFRPRVGELLVNTGLLVVLSVHGDRGGRHRRGLPGGTGPGRRVTVLGATAGRPAGHPGVRHQLRLGFAVPGRRRPVRRLADHDAGLFPVRLPAGGGGAARPRPGLGGTGPHAGFAAGRGVRPGGAAAAAAGDPRRHAAGRAALPVRVRGVQHAAVRHVHHGDLRPVLVQLRQPGGEHARGGVGAAMPDSGGRRAASGRVRARPDLPGGFRRRPAGGAAALGAVAGAGHRVSHRAGRCRARGAAVQRGLLAQPRQRFLGAGAGDLADHDLARRDRRHRHRAAGVPGGLPRGPVPELADRADGTAHLPGRRAAVDRGRAGADHGDHHGSPGRSIRARSR